MRIVLALFLVAWCPAQNVPGLGTDPLKKGPLPPVVRGRTDPPDAERAEVVHDKVLLELSSLIDAATTLRDQLQADGPRVVRAETARRLQTMRKSLRAVESALKSK